jgi:predicted RNA-binding Zn ribbon-like protein
LLDGVAGTSNNPLQVSAGPGFQPAGRTPAPAPLDLVQDFVNTEIPDFAQDDIATPEQLADWLRSRSLLDADEVVDAASFVTARGLRDVLRALALQNTLGRPPRRRLKDEFDRVASGLRLRVELDELGELRLAPEGKGGNRALAAILIRVLDAQGSGAWSRMKACRKEGCGWLFYDASRNASSTWCSMSICGNRTKTAEYRRRRRSAS